MNPFDSIPGYTLTELLAEGGSGRVYRGRRGDVDVAVKVLRASDDPQQRTRFEHERGFLQKLDHPRISRYEGSGYTESGAPWLATGFIRGVPLNRFADDRALEPRARVELLVRCAELLQYAHNRGVIHRDVKPDNLLVDDEGQVHLLDFGVSKTTVQETLQGDLTEHGQLLGTLAYMSPEQLSDAGSITASTTDVYSLGVVAFELLTGSFPFRIEGKSLQQSILVLSDGRAEDRRELTEVDPQLSAVIRKMLQRDPEQRYQSMSEVVAELRRWLAGEAVLARPPSFAEELGQLMRRNQLLVGSAFALFAVTVIAAVISATFYLRESDARLAAEAARADAEQQLQRTRGLTDFLVEMIQSSNPERGGSNALTVKDVLEKAVGDVRGEISDDPAIEATIRCTIGVSMLVLGDQAAAEAQAQRGLELVAGAPGTDAWEECTLALGQALFYRFDTDTAREHLESLLRVTEKPRFSNDVLTKAELNLAIMDSYAGRYEQTRSRMKALVDTPYDVLPEFDEYRLYGVHEYGVALAGLNRYEAAQAALAESVRLRTAVFDATHPQTLFSRLYLARAQSARGDFDAAEANLREVVRARRAAYGAGHRQTLLGERELLHLLLDTGALTEAADLALGMEQSIAELDETPELLGLVQGVLARYAAITGDVARAERHYAPLIAYLDGLETAPGTSAVLQYRRDYGEFLLMQGDREAGVAQLDRAVADNARLLGEDNLMTLHARVTRSQLLERSGTPLAMQSPEDRAAVARMQEILAPGHPMLTARF